MANKQGSGKHTGVGDEPSFKWQYGKGGIGLGPGFFGPSTGGGAGGGQESSKRAGGRGTVSFAAAVKGGGGGGGAEEWKMVGKEKGKSGSTGGALSGGGKVGAGGGVTGVVGVTADGGVTANLEKNPDVTADGIKGSQGRSGLVHKGDLSDGVMGLVVVPLLKKSISEFAVTVSFRGLAVTAKMVLGLLGEQLVDVASVKFLKGLEGVEIGFVEEKHLVEALAKGINVGEVAVPMMRCLHWDPRVVHLVVKGVPTVSVEETRSRVSEVMREYGDVVDIGFQMWEGTSFRTGDVEVRLRLAGREVTGKVGDWPRAMKWGPVECKVSKVRGTEEEEEDFLMALWELEGAVEQRAKAWEAFEDATVVEEINGRKVRVDKKAWEREQGRQVQRDLWRVLRRRQVQGWCLCQSSLVVMGGLRHPSMPLGRRRLLGKMTRTSSLTWMRRRGTSQEWRRSQMVPRDRGLRGRMW